MLTSLGLPVEMLPRRQEAQLLNLNRERNDPRPHLHTESSAHVSSAHSQSPPEGVADHRGRSSLMSLTLTHRKTQHNTCAAAVIKSRPRSHARFASACGGSELLGVYDGSLGLPLPKDGMPSSPCRCHFHPAPPQGADSLSGPARSLSAQHTKHATQHDAKQHGQHHHEAAINAPCHRSDFRLLLRQSAAVHTTKRRWRRR